MSGFLLDTNIPSELIRTRPAPRVGEWVYSQDEESAAGMIAATALEHNLTVVTRNVKDFAGLGVAVLNPWDAA